MDEIKTINVTSLKIGKKPYNGNPAEGRNTFIGGSDAGTILGLNRWKSAYTLWAEKTGMIETPDISNKAAVWWGTMEEDIVAKRFCILEGKKVKRSNITYYLEDYPFIVAHVDRLVTGEKAGLECKTMTARANIGLENGEVPKQYYAQCQHYMMCTGFPVWYIAIKRDNAELYVIRIERDNEYISQMLAQEIGFWNMVLNNTPPALDGSESTAETIRVVYSAENEELDKAPKQLPQKVVEMLENLEEIGNKEKALKEMRNYYTAEIQTWMGNSCKASGSGYSVSWMPVDGRRTINTKKLKEEMPDVYEKYVQTGRTYRRFAYKKLKENGGN